jgi:ABC-type uncharacterized transport system substrate-binding protein
MLIALRIPVLLLGFSLVFLASSQIWGHPHVWVHNSITVHFDKEGIAGFEQTWVFDEMFSHMLIHDYDKNGNNKFEPREVNEARKGAFSSLKNFSCFTHLKIDGKAFEVKFVKDFNAKIENKKVTYHFFVPCHVKATLSCKVIRIGIYDESFYTSFELLKDGILYKDKGDHEVHHKVALNKNDPYYYGQVCPEEIVLRFRKKYE